MRPFSGTGRPWRRVMALAGALGALVVLLAATAMTTQAFVIKVGHTTLDEFAGGEFHRTGLLDIPANQIDSVQLLPIGLFGTWRTAPQPQLPVALTELSAVAGGRQVVVMGGSDASHNLRDEVYVSTIGSGGVLGPWIEQANHLPQALSAAVAAIQPNPNNSNKSWIYVLGGTAGGDSLDTIYYTTLHHDTGTIDPWIASIYPLSVPVEYEGAVAHNGYLYVAGGYSVVAPFAPDTVTDVSYAQIQADGSPGPWHAAEFLPTPLSSHLLLAYGEGGTHTLYVVGGVRRPGIPLQGSYKVYFADVQPDGSLSPWQLSEGNMPTKVYAHGGALINDQIFVTGGVAGRREGTSSAISDTVKAALVDSTNPNFRLYDWCLGVPPPACTIGAWQTGPLLPQPHAFHVTVQLGAYVYTLGGVDKYGVETSSVYWGSVNQPGSLYSPWGNYTSPAFDFGLPADLRRVEWKATIAFPVSQTLEFRYRYKTQQDVDWHPWSTAVGSISGTNVLTLTPAIANVRLVQYRIDMTTKVQNSSPLLDQVGVYYEVDDPEVEVRKNTGSVISVTLNDEIQYTIYYTNNGEWVAENTVLTETLPANTSYAGGPEWQQVGASNVYTHQVGNLGSDATGNTTFRVQVNDMVPEDVLAITNAVEIGYPPMTDAFLQEIVDPTPANNYFEYSNPFLPYAVAITKAALPPPGEGVWRGRVITYTLTYSNLSRVTPAVDAFIVDLVPTYTTYLPGSIVGPGVYYSNPPRILWSLGTVAGGQHGQVRYSVTVDDSCPVGTTLSNKGVLSSSSGRPKTSNEVTHPVIPYAIAITKDALPPPGEQVWCGRVITYTLTYSNPLGSAPAINAYIVDAVPAHTTYRPGSIFGPGADASNPTQLRWNLGTVAAGQHGHVGFSVTVNSPCSGGIDLTNTATLSSSHGHPQTSNAVTHPVVPLEFKLQISKDAIPAPGSFVAPGSTITYTIRYTNVGALLASQPILTDVFDLNQSYTVVSTDPPADVVTTTHGIWHLGPLAPGQKGSIQVVVQLKDELPNWTVTNRATIASPEGDHAASLVVSHLVVNPPGHPIVDLVAWNLHVVPDKPKPGQAVTFYATISNTGTLDAMDYFWAELYIKPQPSYPPAGPSDSEEGYCLNNCSETRYSYLYWVGSLMQGQTNEAWFTPTNTPAVLPTEGCYDVYVQVDVAFENDLLNPDYYNPFWGVYPEKSEDNNIAHIVVCVGPRKVYLPAIFKRKS